MQNGAWLTSWCCDAVQQVVIYIQGGPQASACWKAQLSAAKAQRAGAAGSLLEPSPLQQPASLVWGESMRGWATHDAFGEGSPQIG